MTKTTCGDLWLSPGGSYSCTRFSGHSGRHGERFGERWKAVWSNDKVGERSTFPNEEHGDERRIALDALRARAEQAEQENEPAYEPVLCGAPKTAVNNTVENYKKHHEWIADMSPYLYDLSAVADCPLCGSWWMYNPGISCPKCRRPSVRRLRAETGRPGLAGAGLAGAGAGASLGDRWQKVYTNIGYDEDI